jgi:predicted acetyltransferase
MKNDAAAKVSLVAPTRERLDDYAEALAAGWSPDSERDASAERLTALLIDPDGFFREISGQDPVRQLGDGQSVARLPTYAFWIWDGAFSGTINLRHQPGTDELPEDVSGHIGYTVVPWKRGRGYATRALALLLPVARKAQIPRVLLTCDPDNYPSRRVIETNGGRRDPGGPYRSSNGRMKDHFWIELATGE